MDLLKKQLHFILFPFMAPGHMNPMIDIGRGLAERGVIVTIFTTTHNANRFSSVVARAVKAGLQIRIIKLQFPCGQAGLPEGCENFDMLPALTSAPDFFVGTGKLREPVEEVLKEMKPPPSCIITDMCFPWTTDVAKMFHIPRFVFHGMCCFSLVSLDNIRTSKVLDNITSDSDRFVVPGLPDQIEMIKGQISRMIIQSKSFNMNDLRDQMVDAERNAYGIVINSFEELEPEYIKDYRKLKGKKVWCIGPVSLCNKDSLDKAERGNKASIDQHDCLKWLDSQEPGTVVFVCLGSLSRLAASQLIELGLGLEASNRPFVWAIRHSPDEFENWLSKENYGERIKGKGLLIRGWAPQVLILSQAAVGGFITHCGWNSSIEGICAGVPMITWPFFAEQFLNEKLIVEVLKIGISLGVEVPVWFGEEEKAGVLVKQNDITMTIDRLMDGGAEGEERREKARELGELAKKALEDEGSSHVNMNLLIQDIMEQANGFKTV